MTESGSRYSLTSSFFRPAAIASSAVFLSQTIMSTLPLGILQSVVVGKLLVVVELEVPDELAVPVELLDPPGRAAAPPPKARSRRRASRAGTDGRSPGDTQRASSCARTPRS